MSKSRKKIDAQGHQLSLFDCIKELHHTPEPEEGELRVIEQLRAALRKAIKKSSLSRHQIAGEMSHLLGETITKKMIDSWTRRSDEVNGRRPRHIPAEYLPAFCKATGNNDPLTLLGNKVGMFVLPGPEALRSEIQKLDEELNRLKAEKKKRVFFLREMEGKNVC